MNYVNFKCPLFKSAILSNKEINPNGNLDITLEEAASFSGTIDVYGKNITSLEGIEAFISLDKLDCSYNELRKLNLSKNKLLTILYCSSNKLSKLDLSKNKLLNINYCSLDAFVEVNY